MDNLAFLPWHWLQLLTTQLIQHSDRPFGSFRFETSIITGDNAQ